MLKTLLASLLSRFVGKNSTDTQFVGNLDWTRVVNLSSGFVQNGIDFEKSYTTPESGVCTLVVGDLVEGVFITEKTQGINMTCVSSDKIWPATSCVVSKGRQITFSIRHTSLPVVQAIFVPFLRASS